MTRTCKGTPPRRRRTPLPGTVVVNFSPGRKKAPPPKVITIAGEKCRPTLVLDTFYNFVAKRFQIYRRRLTGRCQPWTEDPILERYPFTNVFRVFDRVTQYILKNVIEKGDQSLREQCFRIMLFRSFNKPETWEALTAHFGELTWRDFDVNAFEQVLVARQRHCALYNPAYIIPSPKLGGQANASNHLRLIHLMMEEDLPAHLQKLRHLRDAHGRISLFPGMGDFMALQLLLDLNMTSHFNYSEDEWVALGPGSLECIRKIFGPNVRGHELDALRYLHSTQHDHFARLYTNPRDIPQMPGRPKGMSMVDIEHALCECEKYSRAYHPNIQGRRQQVGKRVFVPRPEPITGNVPAHWRDPRTWRLRTFKEPPPMVVGGELVYEVSHIVAEKRGQQAGDPLYLIRWVGYGPDDDTWERKSTLLEGAPKILGEWESAKQRIQARAQEFQEMGVVFEL